MSEIIASMAKRNAYDVRLVKGPGDNPRPLADIAAEHRDIELFAKRHVVRALETVQVLPAADKLAVMAMQAAALERAAEIMRSTIAATNRGKN